MDRGEWLAVVVGAVVGIALTVLGLLYLWDLVTEGTIRISEMIHA